MLKNLIAKLDAIRGGHVNLTMDEAATIALAGALLDNHAAQLEEAKRGSYYKLGVEMYSMTTTVHSQNISFEEQCECVPALWLDCMVERDVLRVKVQTLKASEKDLQTTINGMCDAIPDYHWNGGAANEIAAGFVERDALKARVGELEEQLDSYAVYTLTELQAKVCRLAGERDAKAGRIKHLEAELDRERIRLAACGVVAARREK